MKHSFSEVPKLGLRSAPSDILILTGSVGAGHISVAKAISEALYREHGKKIRVEIMDFMTALKNFVTFATKKIYLGSLKLSPKIYELIFHHSSESEWPLKLLNAISAPFMQQKFLELLEEKRPRLLISTYPIWDILAGKAWKKYCRAFSPRTGKLPFISVITDAVSVHHGWTQGNPDFFIVANEDTKTALVNYGVRESRIKAFGYPVAHRFLKTHSCEDFRQALNLSPRKKTLLFILSTGVRWTKIKQVSRAFQKCRLANWQLVIVAAGDPTWEAKLQRMEWPCETRITGRTNEMHKFIHGSDIILTKAGGATVMECIASKRPMVIFEAIPGHEMGNAMLVQKYNLGVVLNRSARDLPDAIEYILTHESLIKKNLTSQQRPNAAKDTAKFLLQLLYGTSS